MSFHYDTLSPEEQEIRLLCIHPSRNSKSPVQCSLKTVSLRQRPKYEALSYVWGTDHATEKILLEGNEFYVTPNLAKALYRLRRAYRKRMMWIDYICINQSDTEEKNTQVPLMGSIYAGADRVVSMLGDATPEIKLAVKWVERYMDRKISTGAFYWFWLRAKSRFSAARLVDESIALMDAMKGVFQIVKMSYWFRTWTYQECLLAKHEPTFICGHLEFKASRLLKGSYSMDWGNLYRKKLPPDLYQRGLQVQADLLEYDNNVTANNTSLILISLDPEKKRRVDPLLSHLHRTIPRQCQNPKDRIYALYGLCPDIQNVYPQDYDKPFEQIMLETTIWLMKHEAGATIFAVLPFPVHNAVKSSHPTWVPDYNGAFSPFFMSYAHTPFMDDPKFDEHYISQICEDASILKLWAYRAGICKVVVQFDVDPPKSARQILDVFGTMEGLWSEQWGLPMLQERLMEAFKIFHHRMDRYSTKEIHEGVQSIAQIEHTPEGEPILDPVNEIWVVYEFAEFLDLLGGNRLLFVSNTHGCTFGISPGVGEDQDILVVPYESCRPLILRSDSMAGGRNGHVHYKVVGQAMTGRQDRPTAFSDGVQQQLPEKFLVI
ncbi:hypothetical protein ASPCADRAFT_162381 [Aspergillus carbonarius ITEM 5010]|uniref:Heterokaryon incompatibility domain-containing protein n=1 Tax=Aspergillus carbonarius (strain ITEM 5010) TaxID=602072 RepID=A0A1R3RW38_ASPC5|nr:hypothetical protein ASPCADRAFT_162381 [Aspergillus carbonarius ITEM 5010]